MNIDDQLFETHYQLLESISEYPQKHLWQLIKEHLNFLDSFSDIDGITKKIIHINTFDMLEKIVMPNIDEYSNGKIKVPLEEIYGDESSLMKKIYGTEYEEQELLEPELIKALIDKLFYLPAILLSSIDKPDIELIKKRTKNKNYVYTKVPYTKAADIEIAASLRSYPKPPTLTELENESSRVLKEGKISKSVWSRNHQKIIYWKVMIAKIEGRLNSKRELKQITIDKLVSLKEIFIVDLSNMEIRNEYGERKSSGDIYEEKNAWEYTDENISYIKTKKDKNPDLDDNFDDHEANELDEY